MSDRVLAGALFLALGIVAYQEVKNGNVPPRSHPFIGLALVFTVLGLLAIPAAPVAAAFAVVVDLYVFFAYNATVKQNQGQKGFPSLSVTGQVPQTTGASPVAVGGS